jgi:hypothetical protein
MKPNRHTVLKLLDRSLVGLFVFVAMVLLGMQVMRAG